MSTTQTQTQILGKTIMTEALPISVEQFSEYFSRDTAPDVGRVVRVAFSVKKGEFGLDLLPNSFLSMKTETKITIALSSVKFDIQNGYSPIISWAYNYTLNFDVVEVAGEFDVYDLFTPLTELRSLQDKNRQKVFSFIGIPESQEGIPRTVYLLNRNLNLVHKMIDLSAVRLVPKVGFLAVKNKRLALLPFNFLRTSKDSLIDTNSWKFVTPIIENLISLSRVKLLKDSNFKKYSVLVKTTKGALRLVLEYDVYYDTLNLVSQEVLLDSDIVTLETISGSHAYSFDSMSDDDIRYWRW